MPSMASKLSCMCKSRDDPESSVWKVVALLSILLSLVAISLGLHSIVKNSGYELQKTRQHFPKSCKDVATAVNGIYEIQPDPAMPEFQVFCDMKSAGGGWTLVAAVHENNINGKCTAGDKWSSEQGSILFTRRGRASNYSGSQNWQNVNVFGTVTQLSFDDYKNPGYYSIQASNVMIWHVPNNTPLTELSDSVFLKYYTTNNFLKNYGSTLRSLYSNFVPLQHAGSFRYFTLVAPPIRYLIGNNSYVLSKIPKNLRDKVTPGFLQFRAFDERGYSNALCPAVKIMDGDSTRVCVGSERARNAGVCGDFAGWGSSVSKVFSQSTPTNYTKAGDDISSSLLIFTK